MNFQNIPAGEEGNSYREEKMVSQLLIQLDLIKEEIKMVRRQC